MYIYDKFGNRYSRSQIRDNSYNDLSKSIRKAIKDSIPVLAKGQVFAVAHYADGTNEPIFLGDNLVVNTAGSIVAQLCRGYTGGNPDVAPAVVGISDGPTYGITHMALGSVGPLLNPEPPDLTDVSLANEYFRKTISSSNYVNETDGTQSATFTKVVDFVTSYEVGEPEGQLTEVGLLGGIDANGDSASISNGGLLFSRRTFPVWNIDGSTGISFTWRVTY